MSGIDDETFKRKFWEAMQPALEEDFCENFGMSNERAKEVLRQLKLLLIPTALVNEKEIEHQKNYIPGR